MKTVGAAVGAITLIALIVTDHAFLEAPPMLFLAVGAALALIVVATWEKK